MSARPILSGFHPDPTICRVGDTYYLATSSFEYQPGVPIFRSTDLVTWTQIGHVLDRPTRMSSVPGLAGASRGIYAPTLRHHAGRFWLIATDVNRLEAGHLIVHADDPAGAWSDPVHTTGAVGIDPDLAWDGDDCYLTWKHQEGGIWQARVDPFTGVLLTAAQQLWSGTGLAHTEGPHLFRRGDLWYLVVAEGGTDRGHAVAVARSEKPSGRSSPAPPTRSSATAVWLILYRALDTQTWYRQLTVGGPWSISPCRSVAASRATTSMDEKPTWPVLTGSTTGQSSRRTGSL